MKKLIQIYTGGVLGRDISIHQIKQKLDVLKDQKPDGIIVGWSLEQEIYHWLREYTKEHKIELYLWFQVLSEYKSLENFAEIKVLNGKKLQSKVFDGDEEFSFYCPSHPDTFRYLIKIYEKYFSEINFDGVLLDRVRFPSLSSDRNALFSCTCPFCMEKLEKRGIGIEDVKKVHMQAETGIGNKDILCIKEYKSGRYIFEFREIEEYLDARTELITDIVKALAGYFKEKGMKVGLDLFAPFLSIFVGQKYLKLSKSVDFIKPMLYRHTYTPAGMEFELDGMAGKQSGRLKQIVGMEDCNLTNFMGKEVKIAQSLSACEIYAGMEIHTTRKRPAIRLQSVREGAELTEKMKCAGRVASWNILEASDENLLAFMGGSGYEA